MADIPSSSPSITGPSDLTPVVPPTIVPEQPQAEPSNVAPTPTPMPPPIPSAPPESPEPVKTESPPPVPPQEPKGGKKIKGTSVVVALVLLAVLAGGGYYSYRTFFYQPETPEILFNMGNLVKRNTSGPPDDSGGRNAGINAIAQGSTAPTYTPTPTTTPTETPTGTPTTTPTITPTNTNTPTPTSSSGPSYCDASCDSDSNCPSGLVCATVQGVKRCRNASCVSQFNCSCPATTPTPTSSSTTSVVSTPRTPVSGGGSVLGVATVAGGILLLLIGLVL